MPDYSKSKIYTIRFNNSNEIYIGSTIQSLSQRFAGHKKNITCSLYQLVSNNYNGNWSNCYIELYENYNCNNKEELLKKEGEIIRLFIDDNDYNLINKRIEGRTQKEYRLNNKDKIKEKRKEYKFKNNDTIKEKNKNYKLKNKEEIKEKREEYYINTKITNFINLINSIFII